MKRIKKMWHSHTVEYHPATKGMKCLLIAAATQMKSEHYTKQNKPGTEIEERLPEVWGRWEWGVTVSQVRVSVWDDKVLKMDSVQCTTQHLLPLNYTLKMVKMTNFIYIFYNNKVFVLFLPEKKAIFYTTLGKLKSNQPK